MLLYHTIASLFANLVCTNAYAAYGDASLPLAVREMTISN